VYTFNGTNAAGCDSTATLNLTIKNKTTSSTTESACTSYLWNGTTYTASGVYTFNGTNAAGCDSTATLNLTIKNKTTSSSTQSVCTSYLWNGTTYTASGVYTFNGTNAAGCDSTATLNLTIKNKTTSSSTQSVCTSYLWNGTTYTASGVYTFNGTNAAGCDSTATLNLTIKNKTTSSSTQSVCTSYLWNGTTYTASGVYTFNGTNAANCDSTATLNLTIKNKTTSSSIQSACTSYLWNGTTYTASGVYTFNGTNAAGCDSTATLNLTIKNKTTSSTTESACTSYLWNGTTYTASGVYTFNGTNAAGCDSTATLNLTIKNKTSKSVSATVCASALPYSWNGGSYTASGLYTYTTLNAAGCDSTVTLNLTVAQNATSTTPASVCAAALPYSWNGTNYTASGTYTFNTATTSGCDSLAILVLTVKVATTSTTNVSVCSSTVPSVLPYVWNGSSYSVSGLYSYTTTNAAGCDSLARLNLFVTSTIPTVSPAITQTLVSNLCGARKYRFTAATTANATGFNWILPTSVGGVLGVTVDSGDATFSRVIVLTFASNKASITGDTIKVRAYSGCGFTAYKAAKLSNTALSVPAAPTAITINTLISNVCGNRKYRYSVPALPLGTATTGAATGYVWEFVGSLSEYATIDSGDINGQKIVVSYTSNTAAATGDSIKFYYTSNCGNSLTKAAKLTNTALKEPAAATAVTITPIQTNVCGARRYRYSAPSLPLATTTTGAATGYVWDVIGSLATTMTIDSGDVNSQKFTVTFTSNAASAAGDSVRVYYTSDCGNSLRKSAKLSNTSLVAPAAATALTITPIQTTICSSRKYRFVAPSLPLATTTAGAASGYVWDFVGSLASTLTVDSGDVYSQKFTVTFTSNAAALTGDSVRMLYTTAGCGNSARKTAKLANTLLSAPVPASITIATKADACNARKYRYIAPSPLPVATATTGAATGYLWSTPTGTVGSTGTIDSGDVTSRIITVTYTSNAAAGTGDSIRLQYTTNGCGNSVAKAQKLSNLVKTGCVPPIAKNTSRVPATVSTSMEVKVYPNPTTSQFNVQVKSSGTEEAVVRVLDVTGRFIKSVKVSSNSNVNLGSDLKAGAYMLEVRQGKEVKTVRVMKF
jgi:peroxiredoxin family protein